jgi:hypothetical protein
MGVQGEEQGMTVSVDRVGRVRVVTITGTATEDQTLTAVSTLEDEDVLGDLSYQWLADGVSIDGAASNTLTLGQAQVGKEISVTVSYRDGQGTDESVTSSATTAVENVNDPPQGAVIISGTPMEGETLTAVNTLTDEDGIGAISYQWNRDDIEIANATNSSYLLASEDVGIIITVRASYTDNQNTFEEVFSSQTYVVEKGNVPLFSASASLLSSGNVHYTDTSGVYSGVATTNFRPTGTLILSAELEETTDDAVEISDVISQLRHIVGLTELAGLNKAAADNDANGSVDISDVINSLRQIVGLQEAPNARIVDAQGNHQFMFDDSVTELFVVAAGDSNLSWTPLELL